MKLLVTGGTGFIGGNFINMLPTEIKISAITRNKNKPKIKLNKNINWINKDLGSVNSKDLTGIDTIVHFASTGVSPQKASWEELYYSNVECTLLLLRAAAEVGIKKILISGSFFEYGLSADRYKFIPSSAALLPITPYASSKAAAFELAYSFCLDAKIHLLYNRIFSAYGEGQFEKNLWPSLQKSAINGEDFYIKNAENIRDFVSVQDVVNAFINDLNLDMTEDFTPRVKNICSGRGTSILDFASFWWKKWNAKGKLLKGTTSILKNEPLRFVGKP